MYKKLFNNLGARGKCNQQGELGGLTKKTTCLRGRVAVQRPADEISIVIFFNKYRTH